MEEGPFVEELQKRISEVKDEYYHLLSLDREEKEARELLEQFRKVCEVAQDISQLERDHNGQYIQLLNAVREASINIEELKSFLEKQKNKGGRIQSQTNNFSLQYMRIHQLSCNLKQASLVQKSHQLSEQEERQLLVVQKRFEGIRKDKTMVRLLQIKKENDDSEYVLNQIDREMEQELRLAKQENKSLKEQTLKVRVQAEALTQLYEDALQRQNSRKIQNLSSSTLTKQQKTEGKISKGTFSNTVGEERVPSSRAIATEIISIAGSREKYYQYGILILMIASLFVAAMTVVKLRSSDSVV